MPITDGYVEIDLSGSDGNAYMVMGKVSLALEAVGRADLKSEFQTKAMSGDYDNLLAVAAEYVEFVVL